MSLRSGGNVEISYDGAGGSTVRILDAQRKDDGWYQCTAVNPVSSAATRARLQVVAPPSPPPQTKPHVPIFQIPTTGRILEPEYVVVGQSQSTINRVLFLL